MKTFKWTFLGNGKREFLFFLLVKNIKFAPLCQTENIFNTFWLTPDGLKKNFFNKRMSVVCWKGTFFKYRLASALLQKTLVKFWSIFGSSQKKSWWSEDVHFIAQTAVTVNLKTTFTTVDIPLPTFEISIFIFILIQWTPLIRSPSGPTKSDLICGVNLYPNVNSGYFCHLGLEKRLAVHSSSHVSHEKIS